MLAFSVAAKGAARHRLTDLDVEARTATCSVCGSTRLRKKQNGWRCYTSEARWMKKNTNWPRKGEKVRYRAFLKPCCERCGFVPEDLCQLDIDHVNGDHHDNRPENLQTLCANCHRLKTKQERQAEAPALAG